MGDVAVGRDVDRTGVTGGGDRRQAEGLHRLRETDPMIRVQMRGEDLLQRWCVLAEVRDQLRGVVGGVDEQYIAGRDGLDHVDVVVHLADGGLVHVDGADAHALDFVAGQVSGVVVVDGDVVCGHGRQGSGGRRFPPGFFRTDV